MKKNIHISVAKKFKLNIDKLYDFCCICVKGSINHGWIEISEVLGTGEVTNLAGRGLVRSN